MDFACGEPFLFSTYVKWTYLSVSSNQSGHISNDLCHLFFSWQSTKLMILGITHHTKLSLLRHCFPVVSCFTMCYIWTCLLSHFFLSLQISADLYEPWLKCWFILSHWWSLIKISMTWKKMEGLQSHSTSWVDLNAVTIYPLHFFTLNGDMRDSKWFLSQLQASLPGIQRALGALILIIKPSHCSELTWQSFGHWKLRALCIDMSIHTSVHLLHYLSNSESWEP